MSSFFHRIHAEAGVDIRLGALVDGFEAGDDGRLAAVRVAGGEAVPTDLVLIGIGLHPNVDLAVEAGLEIENGIVVDEFCRTSDHAVFAIGDCSWHPDSEHGGMRRLESVPNASEQARVVASVITGAPRAYTSVPWFWSDQYDLKLQSVGLSAGYDAVVLRGSPDEGRSLVVFYLKNGEVRAADVVASPRDFAIAKKLVGARARIAPERLGNQAIELKELLGDLKAASA
ncbi:MAG: oxidoreductase C-terminal domain-containing protein [Jiangellaceae bacterium]